ncbi:MAG: exodeoxyribonuclease VII small subunit [Deltaproteobacteria bacterium]|uniref:exodeoxyribonuclease VII small subunit n=1 Tax=Desulfobacula sp. TaxID=2593537 RepID=UPI0019BEA3EF|nr:exodeoxyribonuclease VII small subunit [Candidatus Desulfobacula maris]MBL6995140.1 exodeoxyribonuclease VII small subunit [Desulfobacula sp.]
MVKKTFEAVLKELEEIVRQMESGDLCLEDAVKKYESGMKQSKYCLDLLDKTEKRISLITKDNDGRVKELPFENE